MGRKRKLSVVEEEKENDDDSVASLVVGTSASTGSMRVQSSMYNIMSNVQYSENHHKKYIREMKQLYLQIDHESFINTLTNLIKPAMEAEEGNDFAHSTLLFCATFLSSFDEEETHPLLADLCEWLLTTISNNPHIRFRLCQFVNMILNALGQEAALDDSICDRIMDYMLERLRDISPNVRVQAILAIQRLQVPDNPDDPVIKAYQYHLSSDPSPKVRMAVITCMGRNYHTVPCIMERLWDIDEKVRRHTYVHMSNYPVRSYKVAQRLVFIEQGLNDRSDSVRKVVTNVLLRQWIESYKRDLILFISALKLDSTEDEINRFRAITKQMLGEIFKRQTKKDLIVHLPIEQDGEFYRCVPHEKLTIEVTLFWRCLVEYFHNEDADELDLIVPELSCFCAYVERFCQKSKSDMDKFERMEYQYILLSLMEILAIFDLGDEIGRKNLQNLLTHMLKDLILDEKIIALIVKCAKSIVSNENAWILYMVEIIQDICDLNTKQNDLLHDRNLINELLSNNPDAHLNIKLSSLKVKILDLEEQEMNSVKKKDYSKAQAITDEKNAATEEYTNLLKPLLEKHNKTESVTLPLQLTKVVKTESILQSLQIAFHMLISIQTKSLDPIISKLYNDFICRHLASNHIGVRDWALKCGTTYSMLYETLAQDVFKELFLQFTKHHNARLWETLITCMFELLDRYGIDYFVVREKQHKSKKSGRQLYNNHHVDLLELQQENPNLTANPGAEVLNMMSHILNTCDEISIKRAIIIGFCRLILHGHVKNKDVIEKLLLLYFNPATEPELNQTLSVFLDKLIERKKQNVLESSIVPTVVAVLSAPYDSPLHEIRPESVTRFFIDATRLEAQTNSGSAHNQLALKFLQEMLANIGSKELCKLLSKEVLSLEVNVLQNPEMRSEMKEMADELLKADFESKTVKNLINFKDMLDGNFIPLKKPINDEDTDDEEKSQQSSSKQISENVNTENVAERDAQNIETTANANESLIKDEDIEGANLQDHSDNASAENPMNAPSSDALYSVEGAKEPSPVASPSKWIEENMIPSPVRLIEETSATTSSNALMGQKSVPEIKLASASKSVQENVILPPVRLIDETSATTSSNALMDAQTTKLISPSKSVEESGSLPPVRLIEGISATTSSNALMQAQTRPTTELAEPNLTMVEKPQDAPASQTAASAAKRTVKSPSAKPHTIDAANESLKRTSKLKKGMYNKLNLESLKEPQAKPYSQTKKAATTQKEIEEEKSQAVPKSGGNDATSLVTPTKNKRKSNTVNSQCTAPDVLLPQLTPTVYGTNSKSVSYIRTPSKTNINIPDGPSRSPKIRIEMRFDSDKAETSIFLKEGESIGVKRALRFTPDNNRGAKSPIRDQSVNKQRPQIIDVSKSVKVVTDKNTRSMKSKIAVLDRKLQRQYQQAQKKETAASAPKLLAQVRAQNNKIMVNKQTAQLTSKQFTQIAPQPIMRKLQDVIRQPSVRRIPNDIPKGAVSKIPTAEAMHTKTATTIPPLNSLHKRIPRPTPKVALNNATANIRATQPTLGATKKSSASIAPTSNKPPNKDGKILEKLSNAVEKVASSNNVMTTRNSARKDVIMTRRRFNNWTKPGTSSISEFVLEKTVVKRQLHPLEEKTRTSRRK